MAFETAHLQPHPWHLGMLLYKRHDEIMIRERRSLSWIIQVALNAIARILWEKRGSSDTDTWKGRPGEH